jgi:hypothetical protein
MRILRTVPILRTGTIRRMVAGAKWDCPPLRGDVRQDESSVCEGTSRRFEIVERTGRQRVPADRISRGAQAKVLKRKRVLV